jgi:hypothetical protein
MTAIHKKPGMICFATIYVYKRHDPCCREREDGRSQSKAVRKVFRMEMKLDRKNARKWKMRKGEMTG